eukprot:s2932_g1.t1
MRSFVQTLRMIRHVFRRCHLLSVQRIAAQAFRLERPGLGVYSAETTRPGNTGPGVRQCPLRSGTGEEAEEEEEKAAPAAGSSNKI